MHLTCVYVKKMLNALLFLWLWYVSDVLVTKSDITCL